MAAYFLESSALVKKYIRERGSDLVAGLIAGETGEGVYISRLATVEVTSALARLARGGSLSETELAAALATFRRDVESVFWVVPVTPSLLDRAAALAELHALRAYDAVQLAAVLRVNAQRQAREASEVTFVSSDKELNEAAMSEGVQVLDPSTRE